MNDKRITSERWAFRALKRLPLRQVLLLARHASENASRTPGGCPQSVESAVLRDFEDASRTREGCFWHRISLPYRRSLFFTPNASENASRTIGGRFRYRISLPYRRSLFFTPNASENTSRTTGSLFWHRISLPYRRSLFLVRRASENASHLVVRSTGKRVAVASERPVHPRTE